MKLGGRWEVDGGLGGGIGVGIIEYIVCMYGVLK